MGTHDGRFAHDHYTIRRKILTIAGQSFHVFDPDGHLVFFSRLKAFKLKEDIRLFADENQVDQILGINARSVIDFGATYDVADSTSGEQLGSVRRKGMKSMLRDEWHLFDPDGRQIGTVREDSAGMALARRFVEALTFLFPQKFHVELDGRTVAEFSQNRNPFVQRITADFTMDPDRTFDRRFGLATGLLLLAIEGRQG